MQNFFKKWFGGKAEISDDTVIAVEGEKNAVSRWKSTLESGATAIEYALIASLIAVTIIGAVNAMGSKTAVTFNKVADQLKS